MDVLAPWTRGLDTRLAKTQRKPRTLAAVVLAAGKGKRLKSRTPKVLQTICGRPALWHVLRAARGAHPSRIVIVVGVGGEAVRDAVLSWNVKPQPVFVDQPEQLGTGHAVLVAERSIGPADDVLVMGGDYDPLTSEDIGRLIATHRRTKSAAAIFTTEVDEPGGYARVVHEQGRLLQIVEGTDAPPALRASNEVSPIVVVFRRDDLFRALPLVGRENRQHEYYLNEALPILLDKGERVSVVPVDTGGVFGVNSRADLAAVERVVRGRIAAAHMANGVTIVDPSTTFIDVDVKIGPDTVVMPMSVLQGATRVGARCSLGPSVRIEDTRIGDGSEVSFAVVERATIGRNATVGPFAHLRSGAVLEDDSVVGNFVEVKSTRLGRGSKAKHLTYLGNAEIGKDVNIGAGTVTVNYDGYEKHRTVIGDGARIGSDTMLVAPVKVGRDANTGAGSVITEDVPAGALAVERAEQRNVAGYRKRKDEERRGKGKA